MEDFMERSVHLFHIHPMLVHFPIALFLGALGFEIASLVSRKENLHRTAFHLYIVAALLSPLVVQTGLWEEDYLHLHHPILESHEESALATMWTALASLPILWLVHEKKVQMFRTVFLVFVLVVAVTVSTAAYFGGKMVYEYGIGINAQ